MQKLALNCLGTNDRKTVMCFANSALSHPHFIPRPHFLTRVLSPRPRFIPRSRSSIRIFPSAFYPPSAISLIRIRVYPYFPSRARIRIISMQNVVDKSRKVRFRTVFENLPIFSFFLVLKQERINIILSIGWLCLKVIFCVFLVYYVDS